MKSAGEKKKKGVMIMEFGEKIKRIREARGMTQQTLADQLYVTRQAVSRLGMWSQIPGYSDFKKDSRGIAGQRG